MRNSKKRIFMGIDFQNDFTRPSSDHKYQGALFVEGSEGDVQRTCWFLDKYGSFFDDLFFTLDSHHRWHVADGIMWVNKHGEHPAPFTQILYKEHVLTKTWMSTVPQFQQELEFYTGELHRLDRIPLMIWPTHCQIGHEGSNLHPDIFKSMVKWEEEQRGVSTKKTKGSNIFREHYGAFAAEVFDPKDPAGTGLDKEAIKAILTYDEIVGAGEAENFCFEHTLKQILKLCEESGNLNLLKKIVILSNAMSCVKVPGYEAHQKQVKSEMEAKGIRFMTVEDYAKTLK